MLIKLHGFKPLRQRSRLPGVVLLVALLGLAPVALAAPAVQLEPEDAAVVEALALYDDALRRHALEAVTEADELGEIVRRQQRSSESFRRLLEPYGREVQEDLYELARTPELVSELVEGGPKSQAELEAIAFRYPEEVAAAAARSGREHWQVIAQTDTLLRDELAAFEAAIAHLPDRKQDAFRSLLEAPDLLVLLAENPQVAGPLGRAYGREPDVVLGWLDDVARDVATRGRQDTRELAEALDEDEELAAEVAAAVDEYERDTGWSAYPQPPPREPSVRVSVSPFPFWIGHPWWYADTYAHYDPWYWWYPRFAWSLGGVHFGPDFHASFRVGLGWPHGAFWGWYFDTPRHHHHYARVTHHVVRHYERDRGPRYRATQFSDSRRVPRRHARAGRHAVHRFVRDAERSLPRGFLARDGRRIERFRGYGRLHDRDERDRRKLRVRELRAHDKERELRSSDKQRERRRPADPIRSARVERERLPRLARGWREPERSRVDDRPERRARAERKRGAARRESPGLGGPGERKADAGREERRVGTREGSRRDAERREASRRDAEKRKAKQRERGERHQAEERKRSERREAREREERREVQERKRGERRDAEERKRVERRDAVERKREERRQVVERKREELREVKQRKREEHREAKERKREGHREAKQRKREERREVRDGRGATRERRGRG